MIGGVEGRIKEAYQHRVDAGAEHRKETAVKIQPEYLNALKDAPWASSN